MSISVCMIVRNEEDILKQAIASTVGLADEVAVYDTGSTDGTVELARSLGAIVETGGDRMHKAQSRNYVAEEMASGDWVVVLDADECIADPKGLRAFLEATDARAVYIRLAYVDTDGNHTLSYQQMRCWRRGTYRYKYRAHELPVPVSGWGELAHTDFVWEHRPPSDRKWKLKYTLDRLLLDVQENPGIARPLYYLGRQYMYNSMWRESADTLEKYLDYPEGRDGADAWHCLSKCYGKLGDKKEQIRCLHQACAAQPMRREWWGSLAELYHAEGQEQVATGLLKCALEIPPPGGKTYTTHYWYGAHPHDLLARCLWKQRRYEEGYEQAKIAMALSPGSDRLAKNLAFFVDVVESARSESKPLVSRDGDRKVLYLARRDFANVGYRMAQAVDALDGWQARSVTCAADFFQYPKDIFMPDAEMLDKLCEWADVIHIFDSWPRDVAKWDKPLFVTYNGKYYRDNWEMLSETDEELGITQLCTTVDLTRYGAKWIPVPMGKIQQASGHRSSNGKFLVVHAPTRRATKGTRYVEELRGIQGVEVDIVEGVSNEECLERKSVADLFVDQFKLGHGVNALEAWRLDVPVIANADSEILALIQEEVGYIPFVQCEPESLGATVQRLMTNPAHYQECLERGRKYIDEFHEPVKVAKMLTGLY